MADRLSRTDVMRLLHDKSEESRAEMTAKVVAEFTEGELSADERRIAEDIFRVMIHDTALRVRESLAEHLKSSPDIPHEIAVELAKDVDSVALPILEFSTVLTDEDLVSIVQTQNANKQTAVARREHVSETVSEALIDTGEEQVVAELVANDGADIAEAAMHRVLDTFKDSERVKGSMAQRAKLPVTVVEGLVAAMSEKLRESLLATGKLNPDVASDLVMDVRERTTTALVTKNVGLKDIDALIKQLDDNGRLTPSLLLRALCTGDVLFFEAGLAWRAGITRLNAQRLIHDPGRRGLESVFAAAHMPSDLYAAVRVAMEVANETDYDGGPDDQERYRRRMLERILTQYSGIEADDLDYLLGALARRSNAAAAADALTAA